MITSVDKFLIAVIGSIVFALNNFFGFSFAVDPNVINGLVVVLTPVLVYFMPNKTP